MDQRTCEICDSPLGDVHGGRKYCSRRCQNRARDLKRRVPCDTCGELTWPSRQRESPTCHPCRRANPRKRSPEPIQHWRCQACGVDCERKAMRGQRPKWCDECRTSEIWRKNKRAICRQCGEDFMGWKSDAKFCSVTCSNLSRPPTPSPPRIPKPAFDPRGPLRRALDDADYDGVLAAISARSQESELGCWVWPQLKRGYPVANVAGRTVQVHRLVLEATQGAPLGSQAAHHICANPACVNPDHLQPVTNRDNVAEMLARSAYVARIEELEAALADANPDHPALGVLALAGVRR